MERLSKWSEDRPEAVPSGCGGRQRIPPDITVLRSASHAQRIAAVANALCVRTATVSSQDCIRAASGGAVGSGPKRISALPCTVGGRDGRGTLVLRRSAQHSERTIRVGLPIGECGGRFAQNHSSAAAMGSLFSFLILKALSGAARRHSGAQPYCCGNEMRHWLLCTRTHARRLPLDAASTDAYTCHAAPEESIDRSCTSGNVRMDGFGTHSSRYSPVAAQCAATGYRQSAGLEGVRVGHRVSARACFLASAFGSKPAYASVLHSFMFCMNCAHATRQSSGMRQCGGPLPSVAARHSAKSCTARTLSTLGSFSLLGSNLTVVRPQICARAS